MENDVNEAKLKDELLFCLFKDAELPIKTDLSEQEKEKFLRALILTRAEDSVEEKLLAVQNKYLSLKNKKERVDINGLKIKNNVAYVDNVLNLNCDLIVMLSDNLLENVNNLFSFGFDNELILTAGLEFKADLVKMLKSNNGQIDYAKPYILSGYNLNAKNIAKIIYNKKFLNLIEFNEKNNKNNENYTKFLNILKNNIDFLFNFIFSNNIKSVAFCFNFENEPQANQPAAAGMGELGMGNGGITKNKKLIATIKKEITNYIILKNKKIKAKLIFNL